MKAHYEAIENIAQVITDPTRSDRYLRRADDGHYYTTPDRTFLSLEGGTYTPPCVTIPPGYDVSEEEAQEWALELLRELDDAISEQE